MIASNTYQSMFAVDLQNLIDRGDIQSACHRAFSLACFPHVRAMPDLDRYTLIHEAISAKPAHNTAPEERRAYADFVTFFLMSVPYEQMHKDEMIHAYRLVGEIAGLIQSNGNEKITDKIASAQYIADVYARNQGINEAVNIGSWFLSDAATPQEIELYGGCKAFYARGLPACLVNSPGVVLNDVHPSGINVMLSADALEKASMYEIVLWVCHEMRHAQQRFSQTKSVKGQSVYSVEGRVVNAFPRSAYYALMCERQAYAFDGWIDDMVRGNRIRNADTILVDRLARKADIGDSALDAIENFNRFASQSKNMSARVGGYFGGKKMRSPFCV